MSIQRSARRGPRRCGQDRAGRRLLAEAWDSGSFELAGSPRTEATFLEEIGYWAARLDAVDATAPERSRTTETACETVLRTRGEQDQGAATRPVRRPDLDRDHAGEPVAPRLRDVRQPRRRFGGLAWTAPGRTGRRPGRFGRNFSRSPSAFRFGGFCSRFRRSGPGRIRSPGSWRTCGRHRPQPDAARGPDTALFRKPERRPRDRHVRAPDPAASELPATANVRGSFKKKPCLPTAPCFPGPPVVQKTAPATRTWPLDSLL